MTEKEFLIFLKRKLQVKKLPQLSGYIDNINYNVQSTGKYIDGHSVLFEGHQMISSKMIAKMGQLLLSQSVLLKTKEALLVIIAHHPSKEALNALRLYNINPDNDLRYFAQIALNECEMWNNI